VLGTRAGVRQAAVVGRGDAPARDASRGLTDVL